MYDQKSFDYIFGLRLVVSPLLPVIPSDGENARRIVRHGMKKALPWLNIDPGPKPYEATEMMIAYDPILKRQVLYVSRDIYFKLQLEAHNLYHSRSETIKKIWQTRNEWLKDGYNV